MSEMGIWVFWMKEERFLDFYSYCFVSEEGGIDLSYSCCMISDYVFSEEIEYIGGYGG